MWEVACWADGLKESTLAWLVCVCCCTGLCEAAGCCKYPTSCCWRKRGLSGSASVLLSGSASGITALLLPRPPTWSARRPQVLDNALFAHAESVTDRFFGKDVYYRGELPRERSAILGHSLMCCVFPAPGECMLVVTGPGWQSRTSTCCTFCTWSVKTRQGLCGRGGPSACQPV